METTGSLFTFLEKNDFPVDNQYVFRDSASFTTALSEPVFKRNLLSWLIFDSIGRLIVKDSLKCQWAGGKPISNLRKDSIYPSDSKFNFDFIRQKIILSGQCNMTENNEQPDFTIVITWAKFLGKYNYRLFDLKRSIDSNTHVKIKTLWVNIDMQKSWKIAPAKGLKLD